ncbi:MAG: flap endonuclease [Thermoleophilia bacterium]|nr:flap endonuclease [Thermoleophilia bacterium]
MEVHLVDGTFELFRYFYAVPAHDAGGREVGATRAVLRSLVGMLEGGATHVGVATDHVIESFRNDLWPGYKTGAGIDPALRSQFGLLEDTLAAAGFTVWPMVDVEADDALAAAAAVADADPAVGRVYVCSPDKDLAQCVRGDRVVQLDRRGAGRLRAEPDVEDAYGVPPALIPDWLALMGDSADGFPGLPGFGAKSAAAVVRHFGGLDGVADDPQRWSGASVRGAARLAATFAARRDEALLYRTLARLRTDVPVGAVDEWRWRGPRDAGRAACHAIDAEDVPGRLEALRAARA